MRVANEDVDNEALMTSTAESALGYSLLRLGLGVFEASLASNVWCVLEP